MRALFLVDGRADEPAARTRVYGLLPHLAARGVDATALDVADRAGPSGKRRALSAIRGADVVVLQRVLPPGPVLAVIARMSRALVFDFDDALYALDPLRARFRATLAAAAEVVAGSEELARHAHPLARSVTVVPTAVDPAAYAPRRPVGEGARDGVRLGWIGTPGNLPFLEPLRPAVAALAARGAIADFRVISSAAPHWPEAPVTAVPWTQEGAATALAELDVGVAPLPDTPWGRGKCGLKAIEYMASGLPVVASPVGALSEIVVDGETGLVARSEEDWTRHVERLAGDPQLRERMGRAGRLRVEQRYSVTAAADALAEVLERAVAR